ncbi:MAG: S53 family peptidase [Terriglobales bacterium]
MLKDVRRSQLAASFAILAAIVLTLALPALAQSQRPAPQIIGPEDETKQIKVTYWLTQRDKANFDEQVRQMYDPTSPNFHKWLTPSEYKARFAPTDADMAIVRRHLAANNLKVVSTDKFNHAVTATGTVRDVERAVGVQINRVLINGEEHRMASGPIAISGAAGKKVYAVQGLADIKYKNFAARAINPDTGKPFPMVPLAKKRAAGTTKYFNSDCLQPSKLLDLTTPGQPNGPYEIYSGAVYNDKPFAGPPNLAYCGYDATELHIAYGLNSLYSQKLRGQNQNIVIVDAYGDDDITSDANAFSQINDLPALTSNNFGIFYPTGPTNCSGNTCGWDGETALDVEWSHAMAPDANIALVLAADNSGTNLDLAELFAIETGLGPVISNSWGIIEAALIEQDPGELIVENNINETGAALGVSCNFATGDSGDDKAADKIITVNMPASSPYATAVGGTSLFINSKNAITAQTGWGNNITRIASYSSGCGAPTCDPVLIQPNFLGYIYGAGGGTSAYWAKPAYQTSLSGTNRLLPDIAFLADPYTGVEIVLTEGQQSIGVIGGTSLATPMFSGVWAIANQAAGTWLGQASPLLYKLPAGAITDVTDVIGPDNVNGQTVSPPLAPTYYTPAELMPPLENTINFVSSMYEGSTTRWYAISFGTDSSLTTGKGWDHVTGLGTPNGSAFVSAVKAAAEKKK